MSKFVIQTYGKSEFAMLMFPNITDPRVAQNKLLRWIKLDPEFHQKIQALSTSVGRNDYSADQIRLMVDKWGYPGEYDGY